MEATKSCAYTCSGGQGYIIYIIAEAPENNVIMDRISQCGKPRSPSLIHCAWRAVIKPYGAIVI